MEVDETVFDREESPRIKMVRAIHSPDEITKIFAGTQNKKDRSSGSLSTLNWRIQT
jgi:hypothetical protein